jgi:hypothetical protein
VNKLPRFRQLGRCYQQTRSEKTVHRRMPDERSCERSYVVARRALAYQLPR